MATFRDIANALYRALDGIDYISGIFERVADLITEAGSLVYHACAGTIAHALDVERIHAHCLDLAERALDNTRTCKLIDDRLETYLHHNLGMTRQGTPIPTEIALAGPYPTTPLHQDLHDHIYQGGYNRKRPRGNRLTGHHHYPRGKGPDGFNLANIRNQGANGVYEADVSGPNPSGEPDGKRDSTFFPNQWSSTEVAQAIRAAFANRIHGVMANGKTDPRLWEGFYRNVRIQGYIAVGTQFEEATLDDVKTAWPVVEATSEERKNN